MSNTFSLKYRITIGADFSSKDEDINGEIVTLQIWDTAGQEKYQSLCKAYYRGSDFCAIVFDLGNRQSFLNIDKWKEAYQESMTSEDKEGTMPFILLCNKNDLENKKVTRNEIEKLCLEMGNIKYIEVSAKTGQNVQEAFQEAARITLNIKQK